MITEVILLKNISLRAEYVCPKKIISRWDVVDFKLEEPYAGFFYSGNFECGRAEHLLLELFEYIFSNHERAQQDISKLAISNPVKGNKLLNVVF